jgi:hypothetical protein
MVNYSIVNRLRPLSASTDGKEIRICNVFSPFRYYLETKGEKLPLVLEDSWPRTREESNSLPSPRSISSYSILHAGTMQGDNILLPFNCSKNGLKKTPH